MHTQANFGHLVSRSEPSWHWFVINDLRQLAQSEVAVNVLCSSVNQLNIIHLLIA